MCVAMLDNQIKNELEINRNNLLLTIELGQEKLYKILKQKKCQK